MKLVSVVVSMACFSLSLVLFSSRAYAARFEYDLQPGVSDCFGTYEGCMHINVFRLNDVRTEGHLDLAVLSGMLVIDDELRTASLDVSLRVEDNLVIHYGKTPAEDYRPFKDDELVHLTFSSNPGGNFSGDPWNAGFKVLEPTNGTGVLAFEDTGFIGIESRQAGHWYPGPSFSLLIRQDPSGSGNLILDAYFSGVRGSTTTLDNTQLEAVLSPRGGTEVPEPASFALMLSGLVGGGLMRRRQS